METHTETNADATERSLTINYRAQASLVAASSAVGRFVTRCYPNSVDALPPEVGFFRGAPSVLVSESHSLLSFFLSAGDDGAPLAFGARQAVIVRNAAAKRLICLFPPPSPSSHVLGVDICLDAELSLRDWAPLAGYAYRQWDGVTTRLEPGADGRPRELTSDELAAAVRRRAALVRIWYAASLRRPPPIRCPPADAALRRADGDSCDSPSPRFPEVDENLHGALLREGQLWYVFLSRAKCVRRCHRSSVIAHVSP